MFTDIQVKNLRPRDKSYREWERGSDRGFNIQVTPSGTKTFSLCYSFNGKRRFMSLGRYPETSLVKARLRCRESRALLDQGVDPQERAQSDRDAARRAIQEAARKGSVEQLFAAYVQELRSSGKSSYGEVGRALQKDALLVLGNNTKAREIRPQDIRLVLHKIIKRGAVIQANRLRSYLSAAFRYGIEYDNHPGNLNADVLFGIEQNPVRDVPKPLKREIPGERDLSTEEINIFWHFLPISGVSLSTEIAFKLMFATGGQRVKEVSAAAWKEFDCQNKVWEIPPSRTKNGRSHVVPLGGLAMDLLCQLKEDKSGSVYLFPKAGNDDECIPLSSLSQALSRICNKIDIVKFTPRDIRRTCKTRMGEIGISKEVRDRLHNHALSDVSAKHYDRYDYLREKSSAIQSWNDYLKQLICTETC